MCLLGSLYASVEKMIMSESQIGQSVDTRFVNIFHESTCGFRTKNVATQETHRKNMLAAKRLTRPCVLSKFVTADYTTIMKRLISITKTQF